MEFWLRFWFWLKRLWLWFWLRKKVSLRKRSETLTLSCCVGDGFHTLPFTVLSVLPRGEDKFCKERLPDETHRVTVVPIVVVHVEIARIEVQVATVVRIARIERTRPVVAVGTRIVETRPIAVARSREEAWRQQPVVCGMKGAFGYFEPTIPSVDVLRCRRPAACELTFVCFLYLLTFI